MKNADKQKSIDLVRSNLVKSTDHKITDIKKSIGSVNDFLKGFEKAVSTKLQIFDVKLKENTQECNDCIDILKDYLVKEHKVRKMKRIFKSWMITHNREAKLKEALVNVFGVVNPNVNKKHTLRLWKAKVVSIREKQNELKLAESTENLNWIKSSILDIKRISNKLVENKLDKEEFEVTRKYMDIDYIKH
eukprot:CAMPEP_0116930418 /NCGR_PEP_ID=MMETSP0467-20121206/27187_1 /TAXON_ID=283647 /ORGANISM="Mesodinium pulex, Strain SPMC105" /LENGTH=189 /DNA_ID=CAMNT_0004610619 /DNA_START=356 /DNA_END=925 /DNA_ORIENTATION=-